MSDISAQSPGRHPRPADKAEGRSNTGVVPKTHVSRAMTKLHARDRAQLVVLAYETGLVRPGWTS